MISDIRLVLVFYRFPFFPAPFTGAAGAVLAGRSAFTGSISDSWFGSPNGWRRYQKNKPPKNSSKANAEAIFETVSPR